MSEGIARIWVERENDDHEVEIRYEFTPFCRGARERGTGLALEPDTPASVEILETSLLLTVSETDKALDACWEDVKRHQKERYEP